MTQRSGFALITVLWVIVVATAIAAAGAAAGNDAAAAIKNRVNATRALWRARACADRARFVVDRTLSDTPIEARDSVWRALAIFVSIDPLAAVPDCTLRLVATGSRLDVNTASEGEIERLFEAMGYAAPIALTDALLDWMDADDVTRAFGAESASYASRDRRTPRNGRLGSIAELRYVAGFEGMAFDSVLTTDSARVSIATAPLPVLAVLPGMSTEVLAKIAEWRATGRQVTNLLSLAGAVSPTASNTLIGSYPELVRRSTLDPGAWVVLAEGTAGFPRISASIELKLVRAQSRAALLDRRVW